MDETARRPHRLTDKQALGVLAGYFVFRSITNRVSLAFLPWLSKHAVWSIPLLRNSTIALIAAAATAHSSVGLLVAIGAGSLLISTVAGLVLYWAGYRFGPILAERAQKQGSMWASVWNPKQVQRAHVLMERWGMGLVAVTRASGWFLTPVALVSGSSAMSLRRYLGAYWAGAVVFAGVHVWLGVEAGTRWPWIPDRIEQLSSWSWKVGLGLLVLLVVAMSFGNAGAKQQSAEPTQETES